MKWNDPFNLACYQNLLKNLYEYTAYVNSHDAKVKMRMRMRMRGQFVGATHFDKWAIWVARYAVIIVSALPLTGHGNTLSLNTPDNMRGTRLSSTPPYLCLCMCLSLSVLRECIHFDIVHYFHIIYLIN